MTQNPISFAICSSLLGAILLLAGCSKEEPSQNVSQKESQTDSAAEVEAAANETVAEQSAEQTIERDAVAPAAIADDGKTLWVSPTVGQPLALTYIPAGTQLILHLRMAELNDHPEAEKIMAALGPWGESAVQWLTERTGLQPEEIESLTVAVHSTVRGDLHTTLRIEPTTATSLPSDETSADGYVCFLAETTGKRILVCCHQEDRADLEKYGSEPALFPRDMQRLLDRTDDERTATLVFPTRFLKTEGHKLLVGDAEGLSELVAQIAGDDAMGVALSAHWGDHFFLELQSSVALNVRAHRFGAKLAAWIPKASAKLETAISSEPVHPHGREIVERFPAMLNLLGSYARSGEVEGVSVLRCYLPVAAGHNFLMASELLLSLPNEGELVSDPSASPKTLREKLTIVTSMSFAKDTLEQALALLSEDIGAKIEIAGRDLQLEGITKNQSFGMDLRDLPASEILQAILAQANPDRTAESLSDTKQKLVYVLRDTDSPTGVIVVTTRTAAEKRGDALPEVFVPQTE